MASWRDLSESKWVIIDNGAYQMKAGYEGEEVPFSTMTTVVGAAPQRWMPSWTNLPDYFVGDEALCKRGILRIRYPIQNGKIENWEDMWKIYHHIYSDELRINPSEHPVILTETSLNTTSNRERLCRTMFEEFNVPAFSLQNHSVLSLYSSGYLTGTVVDSGHEVTYAESIFEGYKIKDTSRIDFMGGKDITNHMIEVLKEQGLEFTTMAEREIVRDMKEKWWFVSEDFERDLDRIKRGKELEKEYMLPDGNTVNLLSERFRCPEIMFQIHLTSELTPPIHHQPLSSIQSWDLDLQPTLFNNILISGGNTKFPGFKNRFQSEFESLSQLKLNKRAIILGNGENAVFEGASILSKIEYFPTMWVSKPEYEEYGETIVHRKCF